MFQSMCGLSKGLFDSKTKGLCGSMRHKLYKGLSSNRQIIQQKERRIFQKIKDYLSNGIVQTELLMDCCMIQLITVANID